MAKERTSAAFKAFLGGVGAVSNIQEKQSREAQAEKNREQADRLAEAQRKAVAMNLKRQIEANKKMQEERLTQAADQFQKGLMHQEELNSKTIQANLDNLNAKLKADKDWRLAQAYIDEQWRKSQSYNTAMGYKMSAQEKGYEGEIVPNDAGYSMFKLGGKIKPPTPNLESITKSLSDYAPSKLKDGGIWQDFVDSQNYMAGNILGWDVYEHLESAGVYDKVAGALDKLLGTSFKDGLYKREYATNRKIQTRDLNKVEHGLAADLADVYAREGDMAFQDSRGIMALDAIRKIVTSSDWLKNQVEKDGTKYPNTKRLHEIYSAMLRNQPQQ